MAHMHFTIFILAAVNIMVQIGIKEGTLSQEAAIIVIVDDDDDDKDKQPNELGQRNQKIKEIEDIMNDRIKMTQIIKMKGKKRKGIVSRFQGV